MDEDLIIEVWDLFKEYITDKNKEVAATHFVELLVDRDVDKQTLEGLKGYDPHLDQAIEDTIGIEDHEDEDEDEDEEDWDSFSDEEE